jgi:X-Pro dipeptidyl-peptidase
MMLKKVFSFYYFLFPLLLSLPAFSQSFEIKAKAVPVFEDGEAQVVDAFNNPDDWIRHDLWVETTFDTDGDNKPDRMHVSVTRPKQTDTEGLKLPVIYVTSPYFAGTAGFEDGLFWDVQHELGETPPPRIHPEVQRRGERPIISKLSPEELGAQRVYRSPFLFTWHGSFARLTDSGWR